MSSTLSRYIMRAVLGTTLLVMLVLLTLSGLYIFITQQDEIGVGSYSLTDAFLFVGLNLPKYAFDMLPIAALIGALLALGNMARSMELIVVRAAGVSVVRIAMWVAGAGVILMLLTAVLGELVAPQLEQYGQRMKTFQKYHDYSLAGNRSAWAKDGDTIVSVGQQSGDNRYGGVYVFNFDAQHRLRSVGRASSASIDANNVWRLENFRESRFEEERVVPRGPSAAQVRTRLSAEFLGLAVLDPESLPGRGLLSYIRHLKQNGLDSRSYETAFWARIARTVAVAIIVVLAVPFAFGPMRSTGTGCAHRRRHHDRRRVLPACENAGERRRGVRSAAHRDRLGADGAADADHGHRGQSRSDDECRSPAALRRDAVRQPDRLRAGRNSRRCCSSHSPARAITPRESGAVEHIYQAALLLVIVLFFCVFWTWRGQTLGMLAWRLRVERMDGTAISWRAALIRLGGAWVSFAALGLGYFWIWFDRDRLAWHDRWSGTRVVVLPKKRQSG